MLQLGAKEHRHRHNCQAVGLKNDGTPAETDRNVGVGQLSDKNKIMMMILEGLPILNDINK